jgi:hypothetical protein
MPLLDKLPTSTLGLAGLKPATFGVDPIPPDSLHAPIGSNIYSVNGVPNVTWRLIKGNLSMKPQPSGLDELDANAPSLKPVGVVSQVYKSKSGRRYKDLGPKEGRY